MKMMLRLLNVLAAAASASPHLKGEILFTSRSRHHRITYDVQQRENQSIIDIGNVTGMGSVNTSCNLDSSRIVLEFERAIYSQAFANYVYQVRLVSGVDVFFTAGGKHGCPLINNSREGFLFRRILGDPVSYEGSATNIVVQTAPATYSDVYSSAQVSYSSRPASSGWDMCIGVNADPTSCNAAEASLPLYHCDVVSVTCDDCFAGFKADVFFDLEIRDFMLRSLSGGFRNMSVNAGFGLDMQVEAEKSILSVDKDLFRSGGQDHPILSFKIGAVPFAIWFESTIQARGDLSFSAQAEAKAHLSASYDVGDSYLKWQEGQGWSRIKPNPKLTITPHVEGAASFGLKGSASLPSLLTLHVNQVFTHTIELTAQANLEIHGDAQAREICLDSDYTVNLVSSGQLHISILMNLVHADATYGPDKLWSTERRLPETCSHVYPAGVMLV